MFSSNASASDSPDLVPAGTLAHALLEVREIKTSNNTGARYLDIKLILKGGSFEKRVIFEMVMDPFDPNASEGGKRMGLQALTRICEAAGIFDPADEDTYTRYSFEGASVEHVVQDIDGRDVAIKVKVEKGENGHADKNRVGEWLTPNPKAGSAFKGWTALKEGKESLSATGAAPRPAFGSGSPAARPPAGNGSAGPGWLKKPTAADPGDPNTDTPF